MSRYSTTKSVKLTRGRSVIYRNNRPLCWITAKSYRQTRVELTTQGGVLLNEMFSSEQLATSIDNCTSSYAILQYNNESDWITIDPSLEDYYALLHKVSSSDFIHRFIKNASSSTSRIKLLINHLMSFAYQRVGISRCGLTDILLRYRKFNGLTTARVVSPRSVFNMRDRARSFEKFVAKFVSCWSIGGSK